MRQHLQSLPEPGVNRGLATFLGFETQLIAAHESIRVLARPFATAGRTTEDADVHYQNRYRDPRPCGNCNPDWLRRIFYIDGKHGSNWWRRSDSHGRSFVGRQYIDRRQRLQRLSWGLQQLLRLFRQG